jgi:hypothetical protein
MVFANANKNFWDFSFSICAETLDRWSQFDWLKRLSGLVVLFVSRKN